MKICICDKDEYICNELIKNISECYFSTEDFSVRCFFDQNEMLMHKDIFSFDVFFISGDPDGIAAAEVIRRHKSNAIIIISAENEEGIYDAFRLEALYYIKKPISKEEFSEVFRRILVKYQTLNSSITLRWKNERSVINISDIIYIEGYNRHLTFYTKKGEYSSVGKLQSVCEKLSSHGFLRIHQGYAVNMKHIKYFRINDVVMSDGTKVMISTRRRTEALKIYDDFLAAENSLTIE